MPVPATRLVVLVSGAGTNLQALLDAARDPSYGAQVVAVGADREDIEGLARADRAGVATRSYAGSTTSSAAATGTARSPTPWPPSTLTSSCSPAS